MKLFLFDNTCNIKIIQHVCQYKSEYKYMYMYFLLMQTAEFSTCTVSAKDVGYNCYIYLQRFQWCDHTGDRCSL